MNWSHPCYQIPIVYETILHVGHSGLSYQYKAVPLFSKFNLACYR